MQAIEHLRAESHSLDRLLKAAKRTRGAPYQRGDGSWWVIDHDGAKPRPVPAPGAAHDVGTPPQHDPIHHHLTAAEDALRAAGHHGHADTVKKVREGLGAPAKVRTPKREWKEHEFPIDIVKHGGPEGMRAFMTALSTKEKRAYLKAFNLANTDDRRGNDAALIQLGVQAAVDQHARLRTGGYHGPEEAADPPAVPENVEPPTPEQRASAIARGAARPDPAAVGTKMIAAHKDYNSRGRRREHWYRMAYRNGSWDYIGNERLPSGTFRASERNATTHGDVFDGDILATHDHGGGIDAIMHVVVNGKAVEVPNHRRRDGNLEITLPDGTTTTVPNPRK